MSSTAASSSSPSCVVISGGTGGNAICSSFEDACYVLPVSDDGGSSSEIIRVLGGPSIGDIRSRLIRLIPPAPSGSPLDAIRALLAYRLPSKPDMRARDEWRAIVEGQSTLWRGIPPDRKELIRGFLVYFESEVLKRAHKGFSFVNGSIGNYFLAAAQNFFRSLPSAIFLFSSITNSQANILPVIVTNHTVTIAAELENGDRLVGQCDISHPVRLPPATLPPPPTLLFPPSSESTSSTSTDATSSGPEAYPYPASYPSTPYRAGTPLPPTANSYSSTFAVEDYFAPAASTGAGGGESADWGGAEDGQWSPSLSKPPDNMLFEAAGKSSAYERLPARISRLYYMNAYGHEVHPAPNADYLRALARAKVLVYSCGSLWTSIMPCLALRGVARAIKDSGTVRAKVLLLNGSNDRETDGYSAVDYVAAIARTLDSSTPSPSAFVTHIVHLSGGTVPVDPSALSDMGIRCVEVPGERFDAEGVRTAVKGILAEVDGPRGA